MRAVLGTAAAALVLGGLIVASQASARGFYIGGSLGQSDMDDSNKVPRSLMLQTFDGKDTAYKIFGGYQFSQYFGLELAHVELGKSTYSGTTTFGNTVTGGTLKVSGPNFSAVGTLPLGSSFSLFGKAGLFFSRSEPNCCSPTYYQTDLSLGLGASYNFTKNVGVRAEWERFKAFGYIDLLSVGIFYKF